MHVKDKKEETETSTVRNVLGRCVLITQCFFADFLGGRPGPLRIFHLAASHWLLCPQVQASHGQIDQLFPTLYNRDILRTVCQLLNSRQRGQSVKTTLPVLNGT
jgi:hypothetical protein